MEKTIGFIGCGKMAQAMIQGLLNSNLVGAHQIIASANTVETVTKVRELFQIHTTHENTTVAEQADFLIIAVKPDLYAEVILEIKEIIKKNAVVITVAAGITLEFIEQQFGRNVKAVRTMPNTPSLVREGMTAMCANSFVEPGEMSEVISLFESFGKAEIIQEQLMDAIPAVSGSSPAYVYMFIEALADGAVMQGIPRGQAYKLAAQAVLGAAKMVLETGRHPGELKDQVCTPGGATIEAVAALEKNQFRASIITAMESCTKKSKLLSNK